MTLPSSVASDCRRGRDDGREAETPRLRYPYLGTRYLSGYCKDGLEREAPGMCRAAAVVQRELLEGFFSAIAGLRANRA